MNEEPVRKLRLLLIDDHALFREGLARLLASEPDFEIATPCATADEALLVLQTSEVDFILLGRFCLLQQDFQVALVEPNLSQHDFPDGLRQEAGLAVLKKDSAGTVAQEVRRLSVAQARRNN